MKVKSVLPTKTRKAKNYEGFSIGVASSLGKSFIEDQLCFTGKSEFRVQYGEVWEGSLRISLLAERLLTILIASLQKSISQRDVA